MQPDPIGLANAAQAADRAISSAEVPKKIPPIDDVEGHKKAMSGALASAMLTCAEMPVQIPPQMVGDLAAQLVAYGWRQTEHIDPDAIYAPSWITDGVRQEAAKVPEPPKLLTAPPVVARTATAPEPPKRIVKAQKAVRR